MKILLVADEECKALWDHYVPGRLDGIDLILSAGDLKAEYLEFLVTMHHVPLGYVHGNHDTRYDRNPPEGCVCLEDRVTELCGLRILGLGGSVRYCEGTHQYTQKQMNRRVNRVVPSLIRHRGIDILLTHAPVLGHGDAPDPAHQGFGVFEALIQRFRPAYMVHGHVHMRYGVNVPRTLRYGDTTIINACERFVLDFPDELRRKR